MARQIERVLEKLGGTEPGSYLCPAHDDTRPSLSVSEGSDGRVLIHCFAGCETREVLDSLGLDWKDLYGDEERAEAAYYIYTDEYGQPLIRVVRFSPKGFTQERRELGKWVAGLKDIRRVLYNLPEVIQASEVWVVEGEKDADNVTAQGPVATTLLGGAGKWRDEYAEEFKGKRVIIVGDNDDPGRAHVAKLRRRLAGVAESVRVKYPRDDCKDVTEHLLAGWTLDELVDESLDLSDLGPIDWQTFVPEKTEWLLRPYVPRRSRVLAFGAAGSLKSLWALWLATKLSHEGNKVAYFSLEMRPSDFVKRVVQAQPDPRNFVLFSKFQFRNERLVDLVSQALRDYDLIVVDSWSSAQPNGASNDEVASLDNEVFQPILQETGATLLILDNVGHPTFTDAGKFSPDWARGASAKGDKMEVTLWFTRPFENNHYRTTISTKKMRLDEPFVDPVTIETPRDRIEFYVVEGNSLGAPLWPEANVLDEGLDFEGQNETDNSIPQSLEERLRAARTADKLGRILIEKEFEG